MYALGQASSSADINPQYATTCCTAHASSDDQEHIVASKRNAIVRTRDSLDGERPMPFQVVRDERGMLHRLKFFFLLLCDTSKMVNFNYLLFARVDARNKLIMRQDTYVYCGVRAARDMAPLSCKHFSTSTHYSTRTR